MNAFLAMFLVKRCHFLLKKCMPFNLHIEKHELTLLEISTYNDYFKLRAFNWSFDSNYFCCATISLLNLYRKLIKESDCEGMPIKMNW